LIVVGTGLAGGSASATLAELGYNVKSFVSKIHRVARTLLRHKVELTQQNYQGDGDSVFRLFYETVKGGDYRARESNVHRLAEVSAIIDQCVSGVPAREYGGLLDNRSLRYACF
jgi:succinate dehydrogenase / fumarate reductase flavoprotein subunit